MIKVAFREEWWRSAKLIRVYQDGSSDLVDKPDNDSTTDEYSLIQYNFALFLGIAVQMYETVLIADDTPWDRFRRDHPASNDPALNPWLNTNPDRITRLALFGAHLFNDRTRGATNIRCSNCHEQAELTDASVRRIQSAANGPVRNRDGNIIDKGFNNIGVRPTVDDLGAGADDGFGPLSRTRRLFPGSPPASFDGAAVTKGFGVDGAFKIPSLRNVALTAPYFHNGDARTLREAVELYSRGGNVAPIAARDGTPIEPLGIPLLTSDEISALVAFLEALTDERVALPPRAVRSPAVVRAEWASGERGRNRRPEWRRPCRRHHVRDSGRGCCRRTGSPGLPRRTVRARLHVGFASRADCPPNARGVRGRPEKTYGALGFRHLDGADHQTAAREEQQRERVEPFAEDHVVPAPEVRPGESEVE